MITKINKFFLVLILFQNFCSPLHAQWFQRENRIDINGKPFYFNAIAMSSDGSTMIAGSNEKAIVYTYNGNNFVHAFDLIGVPTIPSMSNPINMGDRVDISADGKLVVISAEGDNDEQGAAFVFTFNGINYIQLCKLTTSDQSQDRPGFGSSVSISGDGKTIIAGSAGYERSGFNTAGASWIFTFDGTTFMQFGARLISSDATVNSREGTYVDLSYDGKTAVVVSGNGGTHVFTFNGMNFQQIGNSLPSGIVSEANITADGKTIVIGGFFSSSIDVYTFNGSAFVKFGGTLIGDGQSRSTGTNISGNGMTIVSSDPSYGKGAFWVFTFNGTSYVQAGCKITGAQGYGNLNLGLSPAISSNGNIIAITGLGNTSPTAADSTVAWIFTPAPSFIPTITGISPSANLFCSDHDYTITVSTTGLPDSFRWYKDGAIIADSNISTLTFQKITSSITGIYKCVVNYSCLEFTSAGININVLPSPTILGTVFPSAVCFGDPVTFTGFGAPVLSISGGAILDAPFIPTITATYTITGLANNGCYQYLPLAVTVNQLPVLSFNGSNTMCKNEAANISVSGANTYIWNNGLTTPGISINPVSNTNFLVTGTGSNGCSNSSMITVSVNSLPPVNISGNRVICQGSFSNLTASGASTFVWNNGSSNAAISVNPVSNTSYTVIGTDLNSCSSTAIVTLTVTSLPSLTISGNHKICLGSSVTLTASGARFYNWSNGLTDSVITVSPTALTTYLITGTGISGCSSTAMITVTVINLPVVSLDLSSLNQICNTVGSVALTGGKPKGGSYWYSADSITNIDISQGGNYFITYRYTDNNSCINTTSDTLKVTVCLTICERPNPPCYCTNTCPPPFKIYEALTPNGDGLNETWYIDNIQPSTSVSILDKWGNEVFKSRAYNNDWNGKQEDGKELPGGIYYYVLETEKKRFTGTLSLIR